MKTLLIISFIIGVSSLLLVQSAPFDENKNVRDSSALDASEVEQTQIIEDHEDDNDDDGIELKPNESNILHVYDEDGKLHEIDLNETLEPDEMYEDDYDDDAFYKPVKISENVIPSLYTRDNPDQPYELNTVNGRDAPVDTSHLTKVIVHGWLENGDKTWVLKMKDKYFINGDYNVIAVDWHKYAILEYTVAARKTRKIGRYIGEVLVSLIESGKITAEDIHIAGHSLGAHIAGIAAKTIRARTGHTIGRLTGLDPAGPLFETPVFVNAKKRIDIKDAHYVDVIHTSSGSLGFKRTLGHSDFFPNGGTAVQPGCGLIKNIICSHARGYAFYTESINSPQFLASPCDSWKHFKKGKCKDAERLSMGYQLDITKANGTYYLRTNKKSPYARG